jgi:hypothetical protein
MRRARSGDDEAAQQGAPAGVTMDAPPPPPPPPAAARLQQHSPFATAAAAGPSPQGPGPPATAAAGNSSSSSTAATATTTTTTTTPAAAAPRATTNGIVAAAAAPSSPLGDDHDSQQQQQQQQVAWRSARHVWGDIQRAAERRQEEEAALLAARPRPALSSRARASARDGLQRLRGSLASTAAVVRARPSVALWSLLAALSLLAAGLWAVLATSAQAERRARDDALFRGEQVLQALLFRVQTAVFPNTAVSMFVYKAAARAADPQGRLAIEAAGGIVPSLLRGGVGGGVVTSAEGLEPNANFYDISSVIRATVPAAGVVLSIMAAPACVVTSSDPLESNKGAIGLNLLCDERCAERWPDQYNGTRFKNRRAETMLTIRRAPENTLAGPYALTQGGWGAIARLP